MSTTAKPHESTPIRPRPHVIGMLGYYGLSLRRVSQACGRYQQQVQHALDVDRFNTVGYETVLHVRARVEMLLRESGWKGEPSELWTEYDAALRERTAA